jgi:hypothetical protein
MRLALCLCAQVRAGVNLMLSSTLVLLGFWLVIVWYCDIDGFRRSRRRGLSPEDRRSQEEKAAKARVEPEDRDVAAPNS